MLSQLVKPEIEDRILTVVTWRHSFPTRDIPAVNFRDLFKFLYCTNLEAVDTVGFAQKSIPHSPPYIFHPQTKPPFDLFQKKKIRNKRKQKKKKKRKEGKEN